MVGPLVALVIYIHSVATVKRNICLYADKTEPRNNVLTCIRTAFDSLYVYFLVEGRLSEHMSAPVSTAIDLRHLLNERLTLILLMWRIG